MFDDDAETPRYIETLPRRGYRFLAKVEAVTNGSEAVVGPTTAPVDKPDTSKEAPPSEPKPTAKAARWQYGTAVALILAIAAGTLYWFVRPRTPVVTAVHQLTHTGRPKSGYVEIDGPEFISTEFNNSKSHVAEVSTAGGEVSYLDTQLDNAGVQDISSDGSKLLVGTGGTPGSLWIVPLPAGPPRRIPGEFTGSSFLPGDLADRLCATFRLPPPVRCRR